MGGTINIPMLTYYKVLWYKLTIFGTTSNGTPLFPSNAELPFFYDLTSAEALGSAKNTLVISAASFLDTDAGTISGFISMRPNGGGNGACAGVGSGGSGNWIFGASSGADSAGLNLVCSTNTPWDSSTWQLQLTAGPLATGQGIAWDFSLWYF
jgi:hypothetical protein